MVMGKQRLGIRVFDESGVLSKAGAGIVAADDEGRIVFANPEAADVLGRTLPVGFELVELVPERLRSRHYAGFERYVETGVSRLEGKPVRVPALTKSGEEVEIDLMIRVFKRPNGSRLVIAALGRAGTGKAPVGLHRIESELMARAYELI